MPLMFNSILRDASIKLEEVRLIRHKHNQAARGHTPYDLWRNDRPQFEVYQSTQSPRNHAKLDSQYWAVFLGTPGGETLFVGLYGVKYRGLLEEDHPMPHMPGQVEKAGTCDAYDLTLRQPLSDLIGRLLIDWGCGKGGREAGAIAWVQYAHKQNKPVTELRPESAYIGDSMSRSSSATGGAIVTGKDMNTLRNAKLSPEERRAIALKAGKASWPDDPKKRARRARKLTKAAALGRAKARRIREG